MTLEFAGRVEARFTVPTGTTFNAQNNGGGPTAITPTPGSYYPTAFCAQLQANLTAQRAPSGGAWSVTLDTTTGQVAIAMSAGTFTLTSFSGTNLATLLGFTSNPTAVASSTGARQCRGLWIPNRALSLESDANMAPRETDLRQSQSPRGKVLGLGGGNNFHRHKGCKWDHVTRDRVWEYVAGTVNGTWETFLKDVQFGIGHAWFSPSSLVQIYDHTNTKVGIAAAAGAGVAGWYMTGLTGIEPRKSVGGWVGAWTIEIPELIAEPED